MNPRKLTLGIALNQLASYEELVLKKELPSAGGTERSLERSPADGPGEREDKAVRRFVIIGGPCTGKTTLAERLGQSDGITNVRSTDSLIHLGWSAASAAASRWFD